MTNNFILLNSDKTEILHIGPKKQHTESLGLQFATRRMSCYFKNLGVILDSNLSFENNISHVTKTAFFHLRNIAKLRNMLTVSVAEKLIHASMTSKNLTRILPVQKNMIILLKFYSLCTGYLLSSVSVTKYIITCL